MGGMSAQIPIKGDDTANETVMAKVRADKLREVTNGHDGTWIAHPLINKIAREIFDGHMIGPNQVRIWQQSDRRVIYLTHDRTVSRPPRGRTRGCR